MLTRRVVPPKKHVLHQHEAPNLELPQNPFDFSKSPEEEESHFGMTGKLRRVFMSSFKHICAFRTDVAKNDVKMTIRNMRKSAKSHVKRMLKIVKDVESEEKMESTSAQKDEDTMDATITEPESVMSSKPNVMEISKEASSTVETYKNLVILVR